MPNLVKLEIINKESRHKKLTSEVSRTLDKNSNEYLHIIAPIDGRYHKKNWFDDYYPNRPTCLNSMPLYEYASQYTHQKHRCVNHPSCHQLLGNNGFIHKLEEANILQVKCVNIIDEQSQNEYFYQILTLFYPWRTEEQLLFGQNNFYNAYSLIVHNNLVKLDIINMFFESHNRTVQNIELMKIDQLSEMDLFTYNQTEEAEYMQNQIDVLFEFNHK